MQSKENEECGKCGVQKMRSVADADCRKLRVWQMQSKENEECGKCRVQKKRIVANAECRK